MNRSKKQDKDAIPASIDAKRLLKEARKNFYKDPNVLGVGIGTRRANNNVKCNEYALLVYVAQKLSKELINPAYIIPDEFLGLKTDLIEPFLYNNLTSAVDYMDDHYISDDMSNIDWSRFHELHFPPANQLIGFTAKIQDFGNICVVEDDGTFVRTIGPGNEAVDFIEPYRLFRTIHGDDYDFVTFFTDPQSDFPIGATSFSQPIYNDVDGIGIEIFNSRTGWNSTKLQQFHFIHQNHFSSWRYIMLQEFGHRWAAYIRYTDPVTGEVMTDHLLSIASGHWSDILDDDKSPMDYKKYEWIELPTPGQFRTVNIPSDQRVYCSLDLYLMGLRSPLGVSDLKILRDLQPIAGSITDFTANAVTLNIQDFINQEGVRAPSDSNSTKYWRQAFVVLTRNINQVHAFVDEIEALRTRWENDFQEATQGLGKVDTFLSTLFRLTTIPRASGVAGYYADNDGHQHVIVMSGDNKLHEIWWNASLGEQGVQTQWHASAIGESAFTPPHWEGVLIQDTPGDIIGVAGYYAQDDQYQHVIIITTNGIVREYFWNSSNSGQIQQRDLLTLNPQFVGSGVAGLYSSLNQYNIVIFATTDGKIHRIFWKSGQVGIEAHDILPIQFAPYSIVTLAAYYSSGDSRIVTIVADTGGKIYQIYWIPGQEGTETLEELPVQFAPYSIDRVAGYWADSDSRHHVIVDTTNTGVHDIHWKSGQVGIEGDHLLTEFNTLNPVSSLAAYYAENDKHQHIIVTKQDGKVYELSFISHL